MKKKIAAILLPLAIAACSSTGQSPTAGSARSTGPAGEVTLTDGERTQVETAVRGRIANDAATFRTILAQRLSNGTTVVCGYFNTGGGDTPFFGRLASGTFSVGDVGGERDRTIATQKACHGSGIYL